MSASGGHESMYRSKFDYITLSVTELGITSLLTNTHMRPKSKLQMRKRMNIFSPSQPALRFKLQRIFEVLV